MTDTLPDTGGELLAGQPVRVVERDGVTYTLLGTAHVSVASVQAVEQAIGSGRFDAVAVELDPQRLQALTDPDAMARLDLVEVIRKGRVALFAANLALAAYQRRLAEQLGIEPGAELKRAVALAKENGLPVYLIDRDVGLTFRRASQQLGFFGKLKLVAGLGAGLFSSEDVSAEEIEKLKQGDMLESSFGEFASESPALYETIIGERDRYMATRLREEHDAGQHNVLAVVGAGHLAGLARYLETDTETPGPLRAQLEAVPKKRNIPWITLAILAPRSRGRLLGAIVEARDKGARIVFDTNIRPALWSSPRVMTAVLTAAAMVCDVVMPTHGDEAPLFGDKSIEDTAERYLELGVEEVVVKDGAGEALVATAQERVRVAPPSGASVVDATGAGDSFNGAYLSARLAGKSLREAAEAAHRTAGIVIGHKGALVDPKLLSA